MRESLYGLAPLLPSDTAVNDDDGFRAPEPGPDPIGEVVEGVAWLGEDDELASVPLARPS